MRTFLVSNNPIFFRKSCWKLNEIARKPRNHIIHGHLRFGIRGRSNILENVIVNIEQVFLIGVIKFIAFLER